MKKFCNIFLEEGAGTFLSLKLFRDGRAPACDQNDRGTGIYYVQFPNQFGYSNAGLSARKLLQEKGEEAEIDAGFNRGVGPSHMHLIPQILEKPEGKLLTALPNAGHLRWSLQPPDNKDHFVDRMQQMTALGVDMAGGCCKGYRNISRSLPESWI